MSTNFWLKLVSAICVFALGVIVVQLYKSELLRGIRARALRRKIIPLVQSMLPLILDSAKQTEVIQLGGDYELMRRRALLETLHQRSKPLFDQERMTIAEFLQGLSKLSPQFDQQKVVREDLENTVLLGQRVIHELTEIGI